MCLIAFAWNPDGPTRLLVAANRDEYYARPSDPADWWDDAPDVWGGRDRQAGGTWLGITRCGRFAALTNVRDPSAHVPVARSRGHLVADFLRGGATPTRYLADIAEQASAYNGFNLLVGNLADPAPSLHVLHHHPLRAATPARALAAGIYGLSNAALDTPWPKVVRSTAGLLTRKAAQAPLAAYLDMLGDTVQADDDALPATGIPLPRERQLSSVFIVTPDYGTRAKTVLEVKSDGCVHAIEHGYGDAGQAARREAGSTQQARFYIENALRR